MGDFIWNHLTIHASRFSPLNLEFQGHGLSIIAQEAAGCWGSNLDSTDDAFSAESDVRRTFLSSYRNNVMLRRYDSLEIVFSRLNLDRISASIDLVNTSPEMGASEWTVSSHFGSWFCNFQLSQLYRT